MRSHHSCRQRAVLPVLLLPGLKQDRNEVLSNLCSGLAQLSALMWSHQSLFCPYLLSFRFFWTVPDSLSLQGGSTLHLLNSCASFWSQFKHYFLRETFLSCPLLHPIYNRFIFYILIDSSFLLFRTFNLVSNFAFMSVITWLSFPLYSKLCGSLDHDCFYSSFYTQLLA